MPLRPIAIALVLAAVLAGCETLPPEQRAQACAATDWARYGENDGRLGVPPGDRIDRFQDCADLGHSPDLLAYEAGRQAGLSEYCTADNGYDVGFEGQRYRDVCPPELEPDFNQGYEQGRRDRPVVVRPGFGIGIGSGGLSTRVGIGIGVGSGFYDPWNRWYW